jgi:glycine/D-amino acid oxidase-like deaminating enzyme
VERVAGGAWCADDGYFDKPQTVVEAFANGVEIEIAEVRRLERDGAGRQLVGTRYVPGTEEKLITADAVVVAAGLDTPQLAP